MGNTGSINSGVLAVNDGAYSCFLLGENDGKITRFLDNSLAVDETLDLAPDFAKIMSMITIPQTKFFSFGQNLNQVGLVDYSDFTIKHFHLITHSAMFQRISYLTGTRLIGFTNSDATNKLIFISFDAINPNGCSIFLNNYSLLCQGCDTTCDTCSGPNYNECTSCTGPRFLEGN